MGKKIRRPNSVTDEISKSILAHHLPYEISMLRALHVEMGSGRYTRLTHNAHIEAFHIHARNLIEFFKNKPPCDFDPRLFTDEKYEPDGNFIDSKLEAKINQQISHLTAQRTEIETKKLGPADWKKILHTIENEIERFKNALFPTFRSVWDSAMLEHSFSPMNNVGGGTGASSSINSLSNKPVSSSGQYRLLSDSGRRKD